MHRYVLTCVIALRYRRPAVPRPPLSFKATGERDMTASDDVAAATASAKGGENRREPRATMRRD